MNQLARKASRNALQEEVIRVRAETLKICENLEYDDYLVQSADFVSPPKWHLAHTSWFFEHFVLNRFYEGYQVFHPKFSTLFNSYYQSVGEFHQRPLRGLLSRPTLEEVLEYRRHVNEALYLLVEGETPDECRDLIELGLNHEQQHQELLWMDIKHLLAQNPLRPALLENDIQKELSLRTLRFEEFSEGLVEIGHKGKGFCFDNESPRHVVFLKPFSLANRPVTNGEYKVFIEQGGYENPLHWLSDGWDAVKKNNWKAPLYWERGERNWEVFSLAGMKELPSHEPVCHLSGYEADAYARWAGARLPTEAEWESASDQCPQAVEKTGRVWEWTQSSYSAYPGYRPPEGSLGEYNGKFMCNQWVLRGGSVATPPGHTRRTYRNFFHPEMRWQFSGLRLAKDLL